MPLISRLLRNLASKIYRTESRWQQTKFISIKKIQFFLYYLLFVSLKNSENIQTQNKVYIVSTAVYLLLIDVSFLREFRLFFKIVMYNLHEMCVVVWKPLTLGNTQEIIVSIIPALFKVPVPECTELYRVLQRWWRWVGEDRDRDILRKVIKITPHRGRVSR